MEGLPKHWEESALQRSQLCQDVESIVDESAPQLLKGMFYTIAIFYPILDEVRSDTLCFIRTFDILYV